jgi:hypothetical protein
MLITPEPVAKDEPGSAPTPTPINVGNVRPTPIPVGILPTTTHKRFGSAQSGTPADKPESEEDDARRNDARGSDVAPLKSRAILRQADVDDEQIQIGQAYAHADDR